MDAAASRDRQALFAAAEALQRRYYVACKMDLEETLASQQGHNSSDMRIYDKISLQQRIAILPKNEKTHQSFLACFGGYNPMRSTRGEVTDHLKDLQVHICEFTICMKGRYHLLYFEVQAITSVDQHKVFQITLRNGEE